MPQTKNSASNYFPALTGIRAIAASMVFLHHYNIVKEKWFGKFIHDCVDQFHIGVTIFFVLSGFLICYRYYDKCREGPQMRTYLVNRFARIYPMYFIVTTISFIPSICVSGCNYKIWLLNLSFLRGFFDEYKFTGAPAGWSLTVEEMFYFLFPFIVFLSTRIRLIFQPLLFILTGILFWMIFRNISFHGFLASLKFLFEFTFFGRCIEFYAGIGLALYVKRRGIPPARGKFPLLTTAGILYIIACLYFLVLNSRSTADSNQFLIVETLVNNIILPFGVVALFYGLLVEKSFPRRILETRLLILLGQSSYVFYLIHNGFLFSYFYQTLHIRTIFIYILLQGISILLYLVLEKPLNKGIRRLAGVRTTVRPVPK